jgi:hypothetical protein
MVKKPAVKKPAVNKHMQWPVPSPREEPARFMLAW